MVEVSSQEVPLNSVDSRLEPLGNTFLNYEDMMLLFTKQRIFRAHSFAGYRPWRLSEKTIDPDLVRDPADAAMDNNTDGNELGAATRDSSSVRGSAQGEARKENQDEDTNTEFGATKRVTSPEHQVPTVEHDMFSDTDADSGNTGHNLPKPENTQGGHAPKTSCKIVHHVTGDPVTTLVIQHLPRDILMAELLQEIDSSGFYGLYDFCYVPCHFKPVRNLGFAFLNFWSPEVAWNFRECWQGTYHWDMKTTRQGIGIAVANAQGKQANLQRCYPRMSRVLDKRFHPFVSHSPEATSDQLSNTMNDQDHDIPSFKQRQSNPPRT